MNDYDKEGFMIYTNAQLKQALAKMLPTQLEFVPFQMEGDIEYEPFLDWIDADKVLDTELLEICHRVEKTLLENEQVEYVHLFYENDKTYWPWKNHPDCSSTWQQRTLALVKIKGIGII